MKHDPSRAACIAMEYDNAAWWCVNHGYQGKPGDPLPTGLSVECTVMIEQDIAAFQAKVAALASRGTKKDYGHG